MEPVLLAVRFRQRLPLLLTTRVTVEVRSVPPLEIPPDWVSHFLDGPHQPGALAVCVSKGTWVCPGVIWKPHPRLNFLVMMVL